MAVSMLAQARALVAAVAFGIFLGAFYDVIRIFRILCGMPYQGGIPCRLAAFHFPLLRPDLATHRPGKTAARAHAVLLILSDFLYTLMAGALFCVFVYWQSNGVFRFYYILAAALGFFAYYKTVGRLVLASAGSVVFLLRVLAAYLFLFLRVPLVFLAKTVARAALCLCRWLYAPLYAACLTHRRLRAAERAFLQKSDILL